MTESLNSYLGIDISKKTFSVALLLGGKEKKRNFSNENSGFVELCSWLQEHGVGSNVYACMEATGRYYELLAEFLFDAGFKVSVVNPAKIKGYAQAELKRVKTDTLDAGLIARFCQNQNPQTWTPAPKEVREIRECERYLDALKGMRKQEHNRLSAGSLTDTIKTAILRHIAEMDSQIAELQKWLKSAIKSNDRLKKQFDLITSVIGVGDIAAFAWLGELGYCDNFELSRQVEAFAGLAVTKKESGTSVKGRERLSKVGCHHLRKALYMPAMSAIQHNPAISELAARLRAKGKPPKVIIGAAMRKLLRIIFAVVKSEEAFSSDYKRPTRLQ